MRTPPKDEIAALVAQSQKCLQAVFDIVTNPTNVSVEIRVIQGVIKRRHACGYPVAGYR